MLFSLIVPFYNVENYIEKCLHSIESQDFRDFEVILVDDGSLDSTGNKVNDFISGKEEQYKLIKQENKGLSGARNTALKVASGEYVVFIDSDDWIEPSYLSLLNKTIQNFSPDIVRMKWFENSEKQIVAGDLEGESRFLKKDEILGDIVVDNCAAQVWKNVYKRKLWQHLSFPEGLLYEDLYTTHLAYFKAQSIYYLDKSFYHYMIRSGSISTTAKFGRAKGIYFGFKARYEWLREQREYTHLKPILFRKVLGNFLQYIHECIKFDNEIKAAKTEVKSLFTEANQEGYKIPTLTKAEIIFFLKMSGIYKLIYKLIRG